jgi:hypothetical protein
MALSVNATEMVKGQAINLGIAVCSGIGVGMFQDVPIDMVPDPLIFGLAIALVVQEIVLVQWSGRPGGRYSKEMEEFTNSMLGIVNSKTFWLGGILAIFFTLGLVLLLFSSRELDIGAVIRLLCVAAILTLGVDPILGTLPKGDATSTVGALVIYAVVIHSGLSGYPELAVQLNSYVSSFPAVTCSSIVLTYLLLSTRWTYIRNLCYRMTDGWLEFALYIGVPLFIILQPEIPSFIDLVYRVYIGA